MTEKQIIAQWQAYVKNFVEQVSPQQDESDEQRAARIAGLEADPEAWFCYYFPKYTYAPPAHFHLAATRRITQRAETYEVRMWSRELAKSTRTMMEVLYLMLAGHDTPQGRRKKKYVLMISNSLDNATRLLMPYRANLEHNKRIIQDYGIQECSGRWQAAEFTTVNGAAFRALGAGQSPRGTRNEEARPDILLFDDVDTDADCLSPDIINKRWRWIEEAAIGTRSVSGPTTIIFCGNRIATDCCVVRACSFADHVDDIHIRDAQGNSTWPEKNSNDAIERVLRQKSYAAAQKEYFNNPVTEGAVFKQMAYKPMQPIADYEHLVCYTDPSYKDTNDYKCTVLTGLWRKEYHIIKCFLEQTTTSRMIDWHFSIHEIAGGGSRCAYYMEDVFMQDALLKELNDAITSKNSTMYVQADKRKKPDKFMRIETLLEPLNRNGRLYLNEDERHNPHMVRLEEQFKAFAPGSRAHDDGPDAVEGAVWLLAGKSRMKGGKIIMTFGRQVRNMRM